MENGHHFSQPCCCLMSQQPFLFCKFIASLLSVPCTSVSNEIASKLQHHQADRKELTLPLGRSGSRATQPPLMGNIRRRPWLLILFAGEQLPGVKMSQVWLQCEGNERSAECLRSHS